ncbi:hypothetical protein Tco_0932083, partial [Tanacetum coccineum]
LKLLTQKCGMFSRRNLRSLLHQPVLTEFMMHIKANDRPPEGEKWAKSQKTSRVRRFFIKASTVIGAEKMRIFCE